MTTSIYDRFTQSVDQFSASTVNRKLSAVLIWLPELVAIVISTALAVGVASLTGSTAATWVALVPALLAVLRLGWANLRNYRRVRAARRLRRQHEQPSEPVDEQPADVSELDRLITAEIAGGQS